MPMKVIDASVETVLPFDAEAVARLVSEPAEIANWHPWVQRIALYEQGGLLYRRSSFVGAESEIVEKVWRGEERNEFHFQAVQGLWSDCLYRSKIRIDEHEDGCRVTWQGRMMRGPRSGDEEQVETYFREGLRGLNELLDAM